MPAYFELSLILKDRVPKSILKDEFSLKFDWIDYQGKLRFFRDKKILFREYEDSDFWEYELSVGIEDLFTRENVIDKIKLLLSDVSILGQQIQFEYSIGNVESNSWFISENKTPLHLTDEMILKSSLIFVPETKLKEVSINNHHLIFHDNGMICLFNPISGLLYSSCNDKYQILKESI